MTRPKSAHQKTVASAIAFIAFSLFLTACETVTHPAAGQTAPNSAEYPFFPDTPEHRDLVERAHAEFLQLSSEIGHQVNVNGIEIFYLEWGAPNGVPLIWAHGYSSRSFELAQVGQDLANAGYRVIALDYRGHGRTQVNDYEFSLSHIADDIAALMDALEIDQAVIGGLSLGGGVATTFYDHYPHRTLAIVLEDGGSDPVQIRAELLHQLRKSYFAALPPQPTEFASRFAAFQHLANGYLGQWGGNFPDRAELIIASMIVEKSDGSFGFHFDDKRLMANGSPASIDPAMNRALTLLHQSWRRVHPEITYRNLAVPMLIIDPTGDVIDLSEANERLRQKHPEWITVVDYPDTPHAAHPLRPDWFVRDLVELLEKVKSNRTVSQ